MAMAVSKAVMPMGSGTIEWMTGVWCGVDVGVCICGGVDVGGGGGGVDGSGDDVGGGHAMVCGRRQSRFQVRAKQRKEKKRKKASHARSRISKTK